MLIVKGESSECKENLGEEKAGRAWSSVDCWIAKGRSGKENWPRDVCQKVNKQLFGDDWLRVVYQRINKWLYEDDWLKIVCQKVNKQLCENNWLRVVRQRVNKWLCENDWSEVIYQRVYDKMYKCNWPREDGKMVSLVITNKRGKTEIILPNKTYVWIYNKTNF